MVLTSKSILMLIAVICAVAAFIFVAFEVSNPKLYAEAVALSLAFGWASFLVP